jgi:hypothetical protein
VFDWLHFGQCWLQVVIGYILDNVWLQVLIGYILDSVWLQVLAGYISTRRVDTYKLHFGQCMVGCINASRRNVARQYLHPYTVQNVADRYFKTKIVRSVPMPPRSELPP